MDRYLQIIENSYNGYARYLWGIISTPDWMNPFYVLLWVSALFLLLEWMMPWRKDQPKFRKDFWLDFFYMFFNYFLFSLIIYNAASNVMVQAFQDFLALFGIRNLVAIQIQSWPQWAQLLTYFIVNDFIKWSTHVLLHSVPFLWQFHKVHHSVEQMGFAAHLRYHWMENVVYNAILYLPMAMIGMNISDYFVVYLVSLIIGHFNHANINVPLGPLKYLLNNPQMHIWHHAKVMPEAHKNGVNFGISLSIWDYLFRTAHIPSSGRDIPLGFEGLETFPHSFWGQLWYGLKREK